MLIYEFELKPYKKAVLSTSTTFACYSAGPRPQLDARPRFEEAEIFLGAQTFVKIEFQSVKCMNSKIEIELRTIHYWILYWDGVR